MQDADPSIPFILLKLISGDTIICKVMQDSPTQLIVGHPVQLHRVSSPTGEKNMYYTQWFFGSESKVHMLRKEHIVSAALPNETIVSDYKKHFLSESDVPPPPSSSPKKPSWDDLDFKFDPKKRFDN